MTLRDVAERIVADARPIRDAHIPRDWQADLRAALTAPRDAAPETDPVAVAMSLIPDDGLPDRIGSHYRVVSVCGHCGEVWSAHFRPAEASPSAAPPNYVPASLSPEWHAELSLSHAEGRAVVLAEIRAAVEGLEANPYYDTEDSERMCPNCVTPWRCNGPHEPPDVDPGGYDVDRAAVLAILDRLAPTEYEAGPG